MDSKEADKLRAFVLVEGVLDLHAASLPVDAIAGDRAQLAEAIEVIRQSAAGQAQGGAEPAVSRSVTAITKDLLFLMKSVQTLAAALPASAPNRAAFKLPNTQRSAAVVAAARRMVAAAAPYRDEFQRHGSSADLLHRLLALAQEAEDALAAYDRSKARRKGLGVGIEEAIDAGASAVRTMHSKVYGAILNNPAVLRAWLTACRGIDLRETTKRFERAQERRERAMVSAEAKTALVSDTSAAVDPPAPKRGHPRKGVRRD